MAKHLLDELPNAHVIGDVAALQRRLEAIVGSADEVAENTGFEVEGLADAPETRRPTVEELGLIRDVLDPKGVRNKEVR